MNAIGPAQVDRPACWPPRLCWQSPIAYGPDGAVWQASEAWLLAEYGEPPEGIAAEVVGAPALSDAELDDLLCGVRLRTNTRSRNRVILRVNPERREIAVFMTGST